MGEARDPYNAFSSRPPVFAAGGIIADRFEVVQTLGQGTSGIVYLAKNIKLGNLLVAVKLFPPRVAIDNRIASRIAREILAGSVIDHPNVVRFYDLIRTDTILGYSMEYVRGDSLEEVIKEFGPPPLPFAFGVMRAMAKGLDALHKHGIVHRDLKPSNILISESFSIKLSDLGLASGTFDESEGVPLEGRGNQDLLGPARMTLKGDFVGTPLYASPEYIEHGVYTEASDIYAYGVSAYEMLCGEAPFGTFPLGRLLEAKVTTDPPPLAERAPDIPPVLAALVDKAIQRKREDRFSSAKDLLKALDGIQKTLSRGNAWDDDEGTLKQNDPRLSYTGGPHLRRTPEQPHEHLGHTAHPWTFFRIVKTVAIFALAAALGFFASQKIFEHLPEIREKLGL